MAKVDLTQYRWKVGFDIEAFVKKDGNIISSSHAKIDGDKDSKSIVKSHLPEGWVREIPVHKDNVCLEFETKIVDVSAYDFGEEGYHLTPRMIKEELIKVKKLLDDYYAAQNISLVYQDSHLFDPKHLRRFKINNEIRCNPDKNIYGDVATQSYRGVYHRYAGFHVHISVDDGSGGFMKINIPRMVEMLDLMLTAPVTYMIDINRNRIYSESSINQIVSRRSMYGAAGTYRKKPYGLEYRTLGSSAMLYPEFVANGIVRAIKLYNNERFKTPKEIRKHLVRYINNMSLESRRFFVQNGVFRAA